MVEELLSPKEVFKMSVKGEQELSEIIGKTNSATLFATNPLDVVKVTLDKDYSLDILKKFEDLAREKGWNVRYHVKERTYEVSVANPSSLTKLV